ncbi:MAG: asparaginase [Opitutales bacterium]|nr:asparaginase [Opitutales bacterium]
MDIKIITTGGTIDKVYFDQLSEFQVGAPQIGEVLKHIHASFEFEVLQLMRKDSLDMVEEDRLLIKKAVAGAPEKRILITHGTDTMAETAVMLSDIKDKVIVLTGSLIPARFRETDATFNIGFALAAVQMLSDGIYIAMNGQVFPAGKVKKNRELARFEPA